MKIKMHTSMLLAGTIFSLLLLCADAGHADNIRVGIAFSIPPYAICEENAGLELDVVREAFRAAGHEARFVFLPNLRLPLAFALEEVDCIAVNASYDLEAETGKPVYPSGTTLTFQNYAVSLGVRDFSINSIADLSGKVVLAFSNAVKYLGPEFAAMADGNRFYSELADQALQVRMLFSRRVEVVVTDKRVFSYWRRKLTTSPEGRTLNLFQRVVFSPVFPPSPRHVDFSDRLLRDQFDAGLAAIRASGKYDGIIRRYIDTDPAHVI